MYDPVNLPRVFVDAGLVDASPRECFDSGIPEIQDIESASCCSNTAGFAIEGTIAGVMTACLMQRLSHFSICIKQSADGDR